MVDASTVDENNKIGNGTQTMNFITIAYNIWWVLTFAKKKLDFLWETNVCND